MSLSFDETASFGAGGSEPYARALRGGAHMLYLQKTRRGVDAGETAMDFSRWNADADVTDLRLLDSVRGPVLDIGCGPGRMVRAAMELGLSVLGIDVSPTAIELAAEAGLPVLARSVFADLPLEGEWNTALLVDGNIGIGGDVAAMLSRCRDLVSADGAIVVELHVDQSRDRTYTGRLVDTHGNESGAFPWAEIGIERMPARAASAGLRIADAWTEDERDFCRLTRD